MDMKISGSGHIAAGEYENVRISGSARLSGLLRCESFHVSGSSHGEELECKKDCKVSGSSSFSKNANAESMAISGAFSCGQDITVTEKLTCSGCLKIGGSLKCGSLSISGSAKARGDIESEIVNIRGKINCDGLLNAEEITIKFDSGMEIGNIGGSKIVIYKDIKRKINMRLPFLSSLINANCGNLCIKNSIEGDDIALEGVTAQRVSGRIVAIGAGCNINLVQYSENVEISPEAKIGTVEQV